MKVNPKLLMWIILGLVAALALTLIWSLELFHQLSGENRSKALYEYGKEFLKTVFIGVCLGAGVEWWLKKQAQDDPSREMLEKSGIERIYPFRKDVEDEFLRIVNDKKTRTLYIAGISLRNFLTQHGSMRLSVWNDICERLQSEETASLPEERRLNVRLLLLDPISSEGYFRYKVEGQDVDNPVDIIQALKEVKRVQKEIYTGDKKFLEVRLYGHCPFSFLFLTEKVAFVEQYYYKDHTEEVALPLIKYHADNPRYSTLRDSLKIIWKNAPPIIWKNVLPERIDVGTAPKRIDVGTAVAIDRARIENIFSADRRMELTTRQKESIKDAQTGTIDIMAISGTHYVNDDETRVTLLSITSNKDGKGSVKVRFALVNPVSQQAILRAVADDHATEKIRESLCTWDWKKHQDSRLYRGVHKSIEKLIDWKNDKHSFELRLYSSSIACALLLTSDSMFIEQYIYGRSKRHQGLEALRREYPSIEYRVAESETENKIEQEIISSTFRIVWDHYSVSYDDYKGRDEKGEFEKNLGRLQEELGCVAQKIRK